MRPDDDRLVPFTAAGSDPELDALADRLTIAGDRARAADDRLRAGFANDLRGRLLAAYPAGAYIPPSATAATALGSAVAATSMTASASATPMLQPVHPRIERTAPAPIRFDRWRWPAVAVAAAVVIAVVGLPGRDFFSAPLRATATDVAGATLERDGERSPLVAGTQILPGDVVDTVPSGHATLALGGGEVRLDGATTVAIDDLAHDSVALAQLDGRAWHRVGPAAHHYTVATAGVTWTATGTAFDLDRRPDRAGDEEVRAVGIQHDVRIGSEDVSATRAEGMVVVIGLGGGDATPELVLGPVGPDDLADPWLLTNGRRDVALGFFLVLL
jgi:hypothetical protein